MRFLNFWGINPNSSFRNLVVFPYICIILSFVAFPFSAWSETHYSNHYEWDDVQYIVLVASNVNHSGLIVCCHQYYNTITIKVQNLVSHGYKMAWNATNLRLVVMNLTKMDDFSQYLLGTRLGKCQQYALTQMQTNSHPPFLLLRFKLKLIVPINPKWHKGGCNFVCICVNNV